MSENEEDTSLPMVPEPLELERPLECTECKRPMSVHYTDLSTVEISELGMCAECPVLQRKLYGEKRPLTSTKGPAGLCCGNCGTTLESVRVGSPLGCVDCYDVFEDVLVFDLLESKEISRRLKNATVSTNPLHIGRAPGEVVQVTPELKLIALNEALDETLNKEDYEQAAWLRDQIKQIEETMDEGK